MFENLPVKIAEAVSLYQPVETEGLVLHPILVREYGLFSTARPAIEFLQQSLPVRYLSVPLLSAYYGMDVENLREGKPSDGLFSRALLFLVLALRYKPEEKPEERLRSFASNILVDPEDQTVLKGIVFEMDGEEHKITPVQFQRMRPILAAQNGIDLESDDANPELVEAERDIAEQNAPELDQNISALVSFVSALTGAEESVVYDWPILKLTRRRESFERILAYLLYGFASVNGAKFKGGNPVPSPIFPRKKTDSDALIDMAVFTKGQNVSVSQGGIPPETRFMNPT